MNILVTGGAGFIGSHTIDCLVERGHLVRVLDALVPQVHGNYRQRPTYLDSRVELIVGRVDDPAVVAPALEDSREVLRDGDNALLVPPDAPEAGAAAIRGLLEDPALQERLPRNAQRDATRYTWDRRAARIAEFLHRVAG